MNRPDINAKRKENIMPRKTTKTKSPVEQKAIAGLEWLHFTFRVPISELAPNLSEKYPETNGDYFWQLPYLASRATMINGKNEVSSLYRRSPCRSPSQPERGEPPGKRSMARKRPAPNCERLYQRAISRN